MFNKGETMKHIALIISTFLLLVSCSESGDVRNTGEPETFMDSVSYSIGLQIGNNIMRDSVDMQPEFLFRGVQDAMESSDSKLFDDSTAQVVRNQFNEFMQQKMAQKRQQEQQRRQQQAEKNQSLGKDFLEEHKNEPGVTVTESGLQYKVLEEGSGEQPTEEEVVEMHVVGKLPDGTVFDDTHEQGKPVPIPITQLVPGWKEAMLKMKTGSTWEIVLPPEIAFGEQGIEDVIPPNTVVILEVELIDVLNQQEFQQKMQEMGPPPGQQGQGQGQMPPPGQMPPGRN